ncbi:hypothetical protein V8E55_008888 [Tylopilus felleus]
MKDERDKLRTTKECKIPTTPIEKEERMVSFPVRAYCHTSLVMLLTSRSIGGRGTMVFYVLDPSNEKKRLTLKMSWQDMECIADQAAVMKRLKDNPHANVVVPLETFNAVRKRQICTALSAIRGFLDDQISLVNIGNWVPNVSICKLKRPVQYFWSLHDFIEGLRGAIKGHEFLTSIGILHRDVSESNIVLGFYPWEERGYLIDFDMTILQDAEEPTQAPSTQSDNRPPHPTGESSTKTPQGAQTKHMKGGTFPYISFNVLSGYRHTHFDDLESFLCPLPKRCFKLLTKTDLFDPLGLSLYPIRGVGPQSSTIGPMEIHKAVSDSKLLQILSRNGLKWLDGDIEVRDCLKNNWPEDLQVPIRTLLNDTFKVFRESLKGGTTPGERTEVSHAQFTKILDDWLEQHSELGHKYSQNHPELEDTRLAEICLTCHISC